MELRSSQAMKLYTALLLVAILMTTYSSAIPKPDEKKRVHEKTLSDRDHEEGGEHNADYDHDAFLGKEEAQTFDQLSPEESRERLGKIVDKIDSDKDGHVTEDELKEWIQYVQRRYVVADTDRMWKEHQVDPDDRLSWESYKKRTYGHSDDHNAEDSPLAQYKETIDRDERRWKMADKDSDMRLTKDEFMAFLHPEEAEHMRDIVVQETLEDIDKDKDGFINMEEYIADIWDEDEDEDEDDEDEDHHDGEPDWVQSEREQFKSYRDKDGDGRLNKDEIMDWIIPQDYDHSTAEAGHLMNSADNNKDGKLTKEEILDKYDVFVGSQATDFGEALMKHDEF